MMQCMDLRNATWTAVVPAAGRSVRFGHNKLLAPLAGVPVIVWSLRALLERRDVGRVVVPTLDPAVLREEVRRWVDDPRLDFCDGGACRAESVRLGLAAVDAETRWVGIHDAARPLVAQGLIDAVLSAAVEHGAAAPALPVTLTVKQACGPLPAVVQQTLARQQLWAMQTPQIVRRDWLAAAIAGCPIPLEEVTDDLQLLELAGHPAWLVEGDERNVKITTRLDLRMAELLVEERG
jgi:2-C-methyl-D-erythritol 4-phosphate cytidylyltransferase